MLSKTMIDYLVRGRPLDKDDWFRVTPVDLRQEINSDELEFLEDVFEIVMEYE